MKNIKFTSSDTHQKAFVAALKKNVHDYFKQNNISTKGNAEMYVKTIVMVLLYISPFVVILSVPMSAWVAVLLLVIMGIGMAGVGMSVMHDAIHGSYSKKKWLNSLMGGTIYLIGSSPSTWAIQHNFLHHTYTNIEGFDEDIQTKGFVRLSKNAPWLRYQRFQHIYAFFFYGFMTLAKLVGDFPQLIKYNKNGLTHQQNEKPAKELALMIVTKTIYLAIIIGLPIWLTAFSWWQVLLGFLIMHMTGGIIMSVVFQMAHVVEGTEQPLPDAEGVIHDEWMVHELKTTSDFAPYNRLFSWYVGGLNFQVEHHLFPNVCHIHYKKISRIVRRMARESGFHYNQKLTLGGAFLSHVRMLKRLGNPVAPVALAQPEHKLTA
jgi:linoleoyl-CoA desaturase